MKDIISATILVGGQYHDFKTCSEILFNFLKDAGINVKLTTSVQELCEHLERSDVLIFYTQGGKLTEEEENEICSFVERGGGFVGIHCANDSFKNNKKYIDMIGSKFVTHPPIGKFLIEVKDKEHPISKRIQNFEIHDELYIIEHNSDIQVLFTSYYLNRLQPVVYVKSYGKGRVFYTALGHWTESLTNEYFQKLLLRGIKWTVGKLNPRIISCGIVGYGPAFSMGKYHGTYITSTPDLQLLAVCDINPERLKVAKNDFPNIETFENIDELLKIPQLDLVIVITPHSTHAPLALKSLQAGKNVVVEKPMCITVNEATEMIETAKRSRVMLSVFHNRRYDGDFLTIKDSIKYVQPIFHIELYLGYFIRPGVGWRSDKKISGGLFYDWGSHLVDWVLQLIPEKIDHISGYTHKRLWHNIDIEDEVEVIIKFKSGAIADIQLSTISAINKPRWRILGENGGIVSETENLKIIIPKDNMEMKVNYKQSEWGKYYSNIADHLIYGEKLDITAESARRVIDVIETAEKSWLSGKPLTPQCQI